MFERDVAAAGGEGYGPERLAAGEVGVGADLDLAIEAGELEVGAAGVEFDCIADALEVGVAEELAVEVDGAVDVGEGDVAAMAGERDVAGDAVGGEGSAAVIDAGGDGAGDGAEFDVSVVCGDSDRGL